MSVAQFFPGQMGRTLGAFFHLFPQQSSGPPPTFSWVCPVYLSPDQVAWAAVGQDHSGTGWCPLRCTFSASCSIALPTWLLQLRAGKPDPLKACVAKQIKLDVLMLQCQKTAKLWASPPIRLYRRGVSPPQHALLAPHHPLFWSRAATTCLLYQQYSENLMNPCSHIQLQENNMPSHESSSEKAIKVYLGTVLLPVTDSPQWGCCPPSHSPGHPPQHFYFPNPSVSPPTHSLGCNSWADVPGKGSGQGREGLSSNKSGLDPMGADP